MTSHRSEIRSSGTSRKARATRIGAVLLAVVGVTAAATSAGFTNDAWFAGHASSANVSLQGKLDTDTDFKDADTSDLAIAIPAGTFDNMVAGEKREVTVDLRNAGSIPLDVAGKVATRQGKLLEDSTKTDITVAITGADTDGTVELAADKATTATITVTATNWDAGMQAQSSDTNTLTIDFTGSAVAEGN